MEVVLILKISKRIFGRMKKKEAVEPQEPVREFPPLKRQFPEETEEEKAKQKRVRELTAIANAKKCWEEDEVSDFLISFIIEYVTEGHDFYLDTDKSQAREDSYIEAVEELHTDTFNELLSMGASRRGEPAVRIEVATWALWEALGILDEHAGTMEDLDKKMVGAMRPIFQFPVVQIPHVVAEEGRIAHVVAEEGEEETVIVEGDEAILNIAEEGPGEEEDILEWVGEDTLEEEEEDILEWVGEDTLEGEEDTLEGEGEEE